jgi:hypothetical protein
LTTTTTRNEPAERLREWIPTAENAVGETAPADLDDALATERRATVEWLRAAIADVPFVISDGAIYGKAVEEIRTANPRHPRRGGVPMTTMTMGRRTRNPEDGQHSLVSTLELSRLRRNSLELSILRRALARIQAGAPDLYRVIEAERTEITDGLPF